MANPALKNGYISIATELVEKFATVGIPSSEMRLIWVVWRKTWGWKEGTRHKDWDWISLSQFERLTTMKHGNVAKGLKSLVVKRILLKREKGYKFNQNYEDWIVVKRIPPVVKRILGGSQLTTKSSSQTHTNNRNKETNTKERAETSSAKGTKKTFNPLGGEIIKAMIAIDPKNKSYYSNKTQRSACDFLLEEYGLEDVLKRIEILPQLNKMPYFPTIYTPHDLKEKWKKLEEAVEREQIKLKANERQVIL